MKTADYFFTWICLNYFWNAYESKSAFIDRNSLSHSVFKNGTDYNRKVDLFPFDYQNEREGFVIPKQAAFGSLVLRAVSFSCCLPNNTSWKNCVCVSENMEMVLEMENVSYNIILTRSLYNTYSFTNSCSYLGRNSYLDLTSVAISFNGGILSAGAAYFKNHTVRFTAQTIRTEFFAQCCNGNNNISATRGDAARVSRKTCIFLTPVLHSVDKGPAVKELLDIYGEVQGYLDSMLGDHSPVIMLHGVHNHAKSGTVNSAEGTYAPYNISSGICKDEIRLTQMLRLNSMAIKKHPRKKRSRNFETADYGFDSRSHRINSARSRSGRLRHDDDDEDESHRKKGWEITYRTARTWTTSTSTIKPSAGPAVWEILHTIPTTTTTTTTTTTPKTTTTAKPSATTTKAHSKNVGAGVTTKPRGPTTIRIVPKRTSAGKTTAKPRGHAFTHPPASLGATPNSKLTGRSTPLRSKKHGGNTLHTTTGLVGLQGPYGGASGRTIHKPVPVIPKLQAATVKPTTPEFVILKPPHMPVSSPLEVSSDAPKPIGKDSTLQAHATGFPPSGKSQPPPWVIPAHKTFVGAPTFPMIFTKKPGNKQGYPVSPSAAENIPSNIHGAHREHAGQIPSGIPSAHVTSFTSRKMLYVTPRPLRTITTRMQAAEQFRATFASSPFVTQSYTGKGSAERNWPQVPKPYQIASTQSVPSWEVPRSPKQSKSVKEDRTKQRGGLPSGSEKNVPETKGRVKKPLGSRSEFPKRPKAEDHGERKQGLSANRGNLNSSPTDKHQAGKGNRVKPHSKFEKLRPLEIPSAKDAKWPGSVSQNNEPKNKPSLSNTLRKQDLTTLASRKRKGGKHGTAPMEHINLGKPNKMSKVGGTLSRPSGSAFSEDAAHSPHELPRSGRGRHENSIKTRIAPSQKVGSENTRLPKRKDFAPMNKPHRTSNAVGSLEEPARKGTKEKQSSKAGRSKKLPTEHAVTGQVSGRNGKPLAKVDEFGPIEEPYKSHPGGLFGPGPNRQQAVETPYAKYPVLTKTASGAVDEMAQISPKPKKSAPFHGSLIAPPFGPTHLSHTDSGRSTETKLSAKTGAEGRVSGKLPTDVGEFGPADEPHHPSGIQNHFQKPIRKSEPLTGKNMVEKSRPLSRKSKTEEATTKPIKEKATIPRNEQPFLWPKDSNFPTSVQSGHNSLSKEGTNFASVTVKNNPKVYRNEPHSAVRPGSRKAGTEETGLTVPKSRTLWSKPKSHSHLSERKSSNAPAIAKTDRNIPAGPNTEKKGAEHEHVTQPKKNYVPQGIQSAQALVEPRAPSFGHRETLLNNMKPLWSASRYQGFGERLPHGSSHSSKEGKSKQEPRVHPTGIVSKPFPAHSTADEERKEEMPPKGGAFPAHSAAGEKRKQEAQVHPPDSASRPFSAHPGTQVVRKKHVIQTKVHRPMSATEHGTRTSSSRTQTFQQNEEKEQPIYIGRRPSLISDDSTYKRLGFGSHGYRQLTPLHGQGEKKQKSHKDAVHPPLIHSVSQALPYAGQSAGISGKIEAGSKSPVVHRSNKPIPTGPAESHSPQKPPNRSSPRTVELPSKYGIVFTARKGAAESAHSDGEFFHRRLWGGGAQSAFPSAPQSALEENRKFRRLGHGHKTSPVRSPAETHHADFITNKSAPRPLSTPEFAPVSGLATGQGASKQSEFFPSLLGGSSAGRAVLPYEGGSTGDRRKAKEFLHGRPAPGVKNPLLNPSILPTVHSSGKIGLSPSDSEDFISLSEKSRSGLTPSGQYLMPSLLEQGKRGGFFQQPYSSIDEFGPAEQAPPKTAEKFRPSNRKDVHTASAAGKVSNKISGGDVRSGNEHLTKTVEKSGSEQAEKPVHYSGRRKGTTANEVPLISTTPKTIWNHPPESVPEPLEHYKPVVKTFTQKPQKNGTPVPKGQTGHFSSGLKPQEQPTEKEAVQSPSVSWLHGRPLHSQFGEGHRHLTPLNEFGESVAQHPVAAIPRRGLSNIPEPSAPELTTVEWVTPRPIHPPSRTTHPYRSIITKPKKQTTIALALLPTTLSPGKHRRTGHQVVQQTKQSKKPIHRQHEPPMTAVTSGPIRSAVTKVLKTSKPVTRPHKPLLKPETAPRKPLPSVAPVTVKAVIPIMHHVPTSAPKHVHQVTRRLTQAVNQAKETFLKAVPAAASSSAQRAVPHTVPATPKISENVSKQTQNRRNLKHPGGNLSPARTKQPNFGPLHPDSGPVLHNQFTTPHHRRKKASRNRKATHKPKTTHAARGAPVTVANTPTTIVPIRHGGKTPESAVTDKPVHGRSPFRNRHNEARENPVERGRSREEDSLGPARENVRRGDRRRGSFGRESQREPGSRRGLFPQRPPNGRSEQSHNQRPKHDHRIEPPLPNRPHEFSRAHKPHEFSPVRTHVPNPLPPQRSEHSSFNPHGSEHLRGRQRSAQNADFYSGAEHRGRGQDNKFGNPNFVHGSELALRNGRPFGATNGSPPQRAYNKFSNPRRFTGRPHWRFVLDAHHKAKREISSAMLSKFDCDSATFKENFCTLVTLDQLGTLQSVSEIAHSIAAVMHENEAKLSVGARKGVA